MNYTPNDVKMMTVNELRKEFGVRKETVQDWISKGGVLGLQVGKNKRYMLRDVIEAVRVLQQAENRKDIELMNRLLGKRSPNAAGTPPAVSHGR